MDDGDGEAASVDATVTPVRRAPYSDNPEVGSRGLRTQQRILDAALRVFGDHGYERSTLDKIAQLAGCSRVSIYQYFSGKDDVFRHLAGQVARQLRASAEGLDPVTPDADGWATLRAWVARDADIHARYEPVFRAFAAAAESDAAVAGGSARTAERARATFQSKLTTAPLPPRRLDPVVGLLLATVTRSLDVAAVLRTAAPEAYRRDRVEDAVTDAVHRSLFGLQAGVNVHAHGDGPPPRLAIGRSMTDLFARAAAIEHESTQPGRRALASLLAAGREVVVGRGYQGTRVDDVVEAAGVSHGAFYRYFDNTDDFVMVVAVRSLDAVSSALRGIAEVGADRAALRRWLRRYGAVHAEHGAMIRVWSEAAGDPLRADRAAVYDWGRRQAARLLRDRPVGDPDVDGLVLLAAVEAFGSVPPPAADVDAAVHVLASGFLVPTPAG